jgi:Na+-transporting NADH:ubiquinone oxidoreductase subunit NqrF
VLFSDSYADRVARSYEGASYRAEVIQTNFSMRIALSPPRDVITTKEISKGKEITNLFTET